MNIEIFQLKIEPANVSFNEATIKIGSLIM